MMLPYPHFALSNLLLANGYREVQTGDGPAYQYQREDELEHCVRRILLRKPERLRGWDLRFLRRGLSLSQGEFGSLVDRDAQTVARWEKSADPIPTFVDLTIRTHFAREYEPLLTVAELLDHAEGRGRSLPGKIILKLTDAGWTFELFPRFVFSATRSEIDLLVDVPHPSRVITVYEGVSEKASGLTFPSTPGAIRVAPSGAPALIWSSPSPIFRRENSDVGIATRH